MSKNEHFGKDLNWNYTTKTPNIAIVSNWHFRWSTNPNYDYHLSNGTINQTFSPKPGPMIAQISDDSSLLMKYW